MALHPGEAGYCRKHGDYDEYCSGCADERVAGQEIRVFGRTITEIKRALDYWDRHQGLRLEEPMTGYEKAVEYLRNHGGGAALNALVEEGYEGDGVDYDKLVGTWKKNDEAKQAFSTTVLKDLQFFGCAAITRQKTFQSTMQRLDKIEAYIQKTKELREAAEQLLAWQPICSLGSSGDLRQKRLRKALDDLG
jgi:hypothetical protein